MILAKPIIARRAESSRTPRRTVNRFAHRRAPTFVAIGLDDDGQVYDVSVDGPQDYFAGGVLVHNY